MITKTLEKGEVCKKTKTTQDAGGQSVSEMSQVTRTSKNLVEKFKIFYSEIQDTQVDVRQDTSVHQPS